MPAEGRFWKTCPAGWEKDSNNCCNKVITRREKILACQQDPNAYPDCDQLLNSKVVGDAGNGDESFQTASDEGGREPAEENEERTQTAGGEGALSIPDDQG